MLLARIAARTNNPYGKRTRARDAIPEHLRTVEPLLRATATAELDAAAPIETLVRRLEELVSAQ